MNYDEAIAVAEAKIEKFKKIKERASLINVDMGECISKIDVASEIFKKLIVNDQPLDKGDLDKFNKTLSVASENLEKLIFECDLQIGEYMALIDQLKIAKYNAELRSQLDSSDASEDING